MQTYLPTLHTCIEKGRTCLSPLETFPADLASPLRLCLTPEVRGRILWLLAGQQTQWGEVTTGDDRNPVR